MSRGPIWQGRVLKGEEGIFVHGTWTGVRARTQREDGHLPPKRGSSSETSQKAARPALPGSDDT